MAGALVGTRLRATLRRNTEAPMNVLLVEDDEAVARFIRQELERAGADCTRCADGDEAL